MNKEENDKLRERSGAITNDSKLVAFLYELMRDHLPLADVETLVRRQIDVSKENTAVYTNGWLAKYAEDLAKRLSE
jgi:hypothetical protein